MLGTFLPNIGSFVSVPFFSLANRKAIYDRKMLPEDATITSRVEAIDFVKEILSVIRYTFWYS